MALTGKKRERRQADLDKVRQASALISEIDLRAYNGGGENVNLKRALGDLRMAVAVADDLLSESLRE